MSDPIPTTPDPLAVALSKLDPAPHGFNRDALMFAAGRASKARALNLWRLIAAAAVFATAVFATLYFTQQPQTEYIPWPVGGGSKQ
jgi:anti-sigma-K factor RskA